MQLPRPTRKRKLTKTPIKIAQHNKLQPLIHPTNKYTFNGQASILDTSPLHIVLYHIEGNQEPPKQTTLCKYTQKQKTSKHSSIQAKPNTILISFNKIILDHYIQKSHGSQSTPSKNRTLKSNTSETQQLQ